MAVEGATALDRDTHISAPGSTIFIALHVVRAG